MYSVFSLSMIDVGWEDISLCSLAVLWQLWYTKLGVRISHFKKRAYRCRHQFLYLHLKLDFYQDG